VTPQYAEHTDGVRLVDIFIGGAQAWRVVKARGSNHSNPWWRALALMVLVMWSSALVACSAHCFLGTSHFGTAQAEEGCHAAKPSPPPCHGGPSDKKGESGALCASLKQLFSAKTSVEAVPPPMSVVYFLAGAGTSAVECSSASSQRRPSTPLDFLFTPEVCPGPANLPHAPPALI